jgi:hypothetical protein
MLGEPGCKRPGAAADVEHAPPAQIAGLGEETVDLTAKLGVRVTKLVVARRELAEAGARRVWRNVARFRGAMVVPTEGRRERR